MADLFEARSTLTLLPAVMTMFMNLFLKEKSGSTMQSRKRKEGLCFFMSCTNEIVWQKGYPTVKHTPSPVAWNSITATILMNCMMH